MAERNSIGIYLTSMTMGGAERVAVNLCSGLEKRGYDVDLILVEATGELLNEIPENVSIIDLNADRVVKSLFPLRDYLSSREPDILYSMMTEPNIIAIAAQRLAATRTRLLISEHNMLSRSAESLKDRLVKICAWAMYPLANDVVAVSEGVQCDLVENTLLNADSISMIYNPVDIESIQDRAIEAVTHEWFSDNEIQVVLAGGRHEPQKGFSTLLDSFSRLVRNNIRLVLFGTGPETKSLKSQAASLGIDESVCFLGFVENPFKYMANAEVFVLSSEYEGFGLVLIEALACGCPVVSTDCESGPAEILEGGEYGSLVPVGDDIALGKAIEGTLNHPPDPDILQMRAEDFNIETAISRYESLF